MSDQVDVADEILEGASEVADGVAHIARGFSGWALTGGFIAGAGLGGALGYFLCQRRLESKYNEQAAEEIAEMREHYRAKVKAHEGNADKGDLEDLVRERGYSPEPHTEPPMAVTPPTAVVDRAEEAQDDPEPMPKPEPVVQNVFQDVPQVENNWDWHKERKNRSPVRPYVIHIDERDETSYDEVTFTYYADDDVLCRETDEVIAENDRDRLVGEANLEKFGHGSGDPTVVYIRNDALEMDIEVCRSPNSYAEEVHGFEPELRHSDRRHTERIRFDDE